MPGCGKGDPPCSRSPLHRGIIRGIDSNAFSASASYPFAPCRATKPKDKGPHITIKKTTRITTHTYDNKQNPIHRHIAPNDPGDHGSDLTGVGAITTGIYVHRPHWRLPCLRLLSRHRGSPSISTPWRTFDYIGQWETFTPADGTFTIGDHIDLIWAWKCSFLHLKSYMYGPNKKIVGISGNHSICTNICGEQAIYDDHRIMNVEARIDGSSRQLNLPSKCPAELIMYPVGLYAYWGVPWAWTRVNSAVKVQGISHSACSALGYEQHVVSDHGTSPIATPFESCSDNYLIVTLDNVQQSNTTAISSLPMICVNGVGADVANGSMTYGVVPTGAIGAVFQTSGGALSFVSPIYQSGAMAVSLGTGELVKRAKNITPDKQFKQYVLTVDLDGVTPDEMDAIFLD